MIGISLSNKETLSTFPSSVIYCKWPDIRSAKRFWVICRDAMIHFYRVYTAVIGNSICIIYKSKKEK